MQAEGPKGQQLREEFTKNLTCFASGLTESELSMIPGRIRQSAEMRQHSNAESNRREKVKPGKALWMRFLTRQAKR